jgi:DNA-binding XRE family transcriptional regulator
MVVQKMQGSRASYIGCPKNDIRAGCPTSSKNCSLNRDVECLSVGTIFAHSFSERSAMAAHLQLPRKMAPNPIDQHVGSRVRMRREMLAMSQHKLGAALGLTFQQVQKYEKGATRIAASRLQQMSHVLQVPVAFFFEGMPNALAPHNSNESASSTARLMTSSPIQTA